MLDSDAGMPRLDRLTSASLSLPVVPPAPNPAFKNCQQIGISAGRRTRVGTVLPLTGEFFEVGEKILDKGSGCGIM
jgi:hypothetical protein